MNEPQEPQEQDKSIASRQESLLRLYLGIFYALAVFSGVNLLRDLWAGDRISSVLSNASLFLLAISNIVSERRTGRRPSLIAIVLGGIAIILFGLSFFVKP